MTKQEDRIWAELAKIPGGYEYSGVASLQLCFPLRAGGELRFLVTEDRPEHISIDLYDGMLPPGISGPAWKTGEKKE